MDYYSEGCFVYKRFNKGCVLSPSEMSGSQKVQWFALTAEYGQDFYGPIVHTYVFNRMPRLNVGSNEVRTKLRSTAEAGEGKSLAREFSADEQWSGGAGNFVFTDLVRKYFYEKYDGTIVVDDSDATDEDNKGPTEIVLWKNFSDILTLV